MWYFYDQVSRLSQVTVYGDFSSRKALRTPVVSLNIGEEDSGWAAGELAERYGIQTRAGAHCAPLMHEALKTGIGELFVFPFPISIPGKRQKWLFMQ